MLELSTRQSSELDEGTSTPVTVEFTVKTIKEELVDELKQAINFYLNKRKLTLDRLDSLSKRNREFINILVNLIEDKELTALELRQHIFNFYNHYRTRFDWLASMLSTSSLFYLIDRAILSNPYFSQHNIMMQAYNQLSRQFQSSLVKHTDEIYRTNREIAKLEIDIEAYKIANDTLKKELECMREGSDIKTYLTANHSLQQKIKRIDVLTKQQGLQVKKLQAEIRMQDHTITEMNEQISQLQESKEALTKENSTLKKENAETIDENLSLLKQNLELEQENRDLKTELAYLKHTQQKQMKKMLKQLRLEKTDAIKMNLYGLKIQTDAETKTEPRKLITCHT